MERRAKDAKAGGFRRDDDGPDDAASPSPARAGGQPPATSGARRLGKVRKSGNGYSLVEVLAGDGPDPVGYCVLGPGIGLAAGWVLDLPEAELAFASRVSAETREPKRRRPIRRQPRA